jgi:hypothetical protein
MHYFPPALLGGEPPKAHQMLVVAVINGLLPQSITFAMLITEITLFIWRIMVPDILEPVRGSGFIYLVLIFSLVPMITLIGWFGASITFPVEK